MRNRLEQPVVDKVREVLHNVFSYPLPSIQKDANNITVYEQDSYKTNFELQKLLNHASKCNRSLQEKLWTEEADAGKPEFLIINSNDNLAIVIECKANLAKKHIGVQLRDNNLLEKNATLISSNACEGVLHYAKFLAVNYDVIAVGVSGNIEPDGSVSELKISTFAWEKDKEWQYGVSGPFIDLQINTLMSYSEYQQAHKNVSMIKRNIIESNALGIAKELNETLHKASVPPIERSLLISGLLLVLKNPIFVNSYQDKKVSNNALLKLLGTSVADILDGLEVKDTFKKSMLVTKFKDIFNQPGLLKSNAAVLRDVLKTLEVSVAPYMTGEYSIDIVGKFYSEFLRYAKGDKSSGIVLTPTHITDLFCDLVKLNSDDIVLDPCAGTAGFLIAAMNRLYTLADNQTDSDDKKEHIKNFQLYGADDDKQMFAIGCSNMILRGDGKANMHFGSCMDFFDELSNVATIGMINPPYSGSDISCLEFLDYLCKCIRHKDNKGEYIGQSRSKGDNLVCGIIPTSYMNSDDWQEQRLKLLGNNTLVAVMSMPIDLFRPINVITCIVLLKAGIPHDPEIPTYLGNWKDDGYVWRKKLGRVPNGNMPQTMKVRWLKSFNRTVEDKSIGIWQCLDGSDECCWEKYAETDYSVITQDLFEEEIKSFVLYRLKESLNIDIDDKDENINEDE